MSSSRFVSLIWIGLIYLDGMEKVKPGMSAYSDTVISRWQLKHLPTLRIVLPAKSLHVSLLICRICSEDSSFIPRAFSTFSRIWTIRTLLCTDTRLLLCDTLFHSLLETNAPSIRRSSRSGCRFHSHCHRFLFTSFLVTLREFTRFPIAPSSITSAAHAQSRSRALSVYSGVVETISCTSTLLLSCREGNTIFSQTGVVLGKNKRAGIEGTCYVAGSRALLSVANVTIPLWLISLFEKRNMVFFTPLKGIIFTGANWTKVWSVEFAVIASCLLAPIAMGLVSPIGKITIDVPVVDDEKEEKSEPKTSPEKVFYFRGYWPVCGET